MEAKTRLKLLLDDAWRSVAIQLYKWWFQLHEPDTATIRLFVSQDKYAIWAIVPKEGYVWTAFRHYRELPTEAQVDLMLAIVEDMALQNNVNIWKIKNSRPLYYQEGGQ